MDQQRYSNVMMGRNMMGQDSMGQDSMGQDSMGQDSMGHNMMGQETMGRNLMDQHNMGRDMMRQGNMGQNMMGRNIYNIMSNRGMTADMSKIMGQQMESNMMGQGKTMDAMGRNIMGQDRISQMISRNMIGQAMLGMTNNQMSSNMIDSKDRLMGQHMMQKMERIPETYTSTRIF